MSEMIRVDDLSGIECTDPASFDSIQQQYSLVGTWDSARREIRIALLDGVPKRREDFRQMVVEIAALAAENACNDLGIGA